MGAAAAFTVASLGACNSSVKEQPAKTELRWLGWQHYDIKNITAAFEKQFGVRVRAEFIDSNYDAWKILQSAGAQNFDVVMADGFWPQLYAKQGLIQPVDYTKLSNIKHVFPDFLPPHYKPLREEIGEQMVAAPNCWGGYGLTVNRDKVAEEDTESLNLLFNEKYKGHLATSGRYQENIALAGILVCHNLGTIDGPRPDGKRFNPYVLTNTELEECTKLLIKQKRLLASRWNDEDTLEGLLRTQVAWASPDWSGVYRRIRFDYLDNKTDLNLKHVLKPTEGGLGWVDGWAITSGVASSEKLELAHEWINFRLQPENMATLATTIGWSPTVDVRTLIPDRYGETLFLNETHAMRGLYQFDAPSSTAKWERVWSEVEVA